MSSPSVSSQQSDTARRRRQPPRLDWPGSIPVAKRPRNQQQLQLWSEKYTPETSKDLSVAAKRVGLVRTWIDSHSGRGGLLVLVGGPGIGKSTMVRVLAREANVTLLEYTEPLFDSRQGETALGCWEKFLSSVAVPLSALSNTTSDTEAAHGKKNLILIDELPNMHDSAGEARFRDSLALLLRSGRVPAIMVYSDTVEGKAAGVERLVPVELGAEVMQIHQPTKARFGKIVRNVISRERLPKTIKTDELHEVCHGDLRFALQSLQSGGSFRDTKLTPFHALGKILYSKRNAATNQLEFDPEGVIEQSGMDLSMVLHFAQHHTVDFFTDVDDLSKALEYFSDASMFMDYPAATSLVGRAVAATNRHPAATKYRQLSSPPIYDVLKKRRMNAARIPSTTYALDVLPLAQRIQPCISLTSFLNPHAVATADQTSQEEARVEREQRQILEADDIVEDEDDSWL